MKIRVECYSGYRGEETPRRFWLDGKPVEIQDVLDRWIDPAHRYFKVVDGDRAVYILRHDAMTFEWDLTFFQSERAIK